MSSVLLFDISENANLLPINRASVAEQLARIGVHLPLVGDVRKDEPFDSDKIRIAGECCRQGRSISTTEYLHPKGQAGRPSNLASNSYHDGDDLWPDLPAQVRSIMHVLNHQAVKSGIAQLACRIQCLVADLIDGQLALRRTRKCRDMDHPYQGAPNPKNRSDNLTLIHNVSLRG